MKINVFVILGIFVLLFAGCINQNPPTTLQTNSNSEYKQTCRTVTFSEPYTDQECNSVPYTDQDCQQVQMKFTKSDVTCTKEGLLLDWSVTSCKITNLDDQVGTFQTFTGFVISGQNVGETQSAAIYPQQSHTFSYRLKSDSTGCYCYEFLIPEKQVCRDVIKNRQECRSITRYRTVEKQECN